MSSAGETSGIPSTSITLLKDNCKQQLQKSLVVPKSVLLASNHVAWYLRSSFYLDFILVFGIFAVSLLQSCPCMNISCLRADNSKITWYQPGTCCNCK